MSKHYSGGFLRTLRNDIPIDKVIEDWVKLQVIHEPSRMRFQCPLCCNFHTATNPETNLARCFDCGKNYNPIDLVMSAAQYDFLDAVEFLKKKMNR